MNQTPHNQTKAELRRVLRDRRDRFVAGLDKATRALAFRVLPAPVARQLTGAKVVAVYQPTGSEAPTAGIAAQLNQMGVTTALPRIDPASGGMVFARWSPDDILVPGPFRLMQPAPFADIVEPDVIIAPLIGFDRQLNRLGQGGGYYDRAFACLPDALAIGLAWSAQLVDAVPVEPFDKALSMIVTESALYEASDA